MSFGELAGVGLGGPGGLGAGLNPSSFFSGGFGVDKTGLTGPANPLGNSTAASGGLGIGTGLGIASAAFSLSKGIDPDDPLSIAKQAASVGSLIPGVGMIFAGVGLGLNLLEGLLPTEDEKRAGEEARQRVFANLARDMRNDFKRQQFIARLDSVDQQLDNNWAAAWKDWVNIQRNTNTTLEVAAFKQADMVKRVTEIAGAHAAREVYGRTAARAAAVSSYGQFGVATAQLTKQKQAVVGKAVEDMKATNLSLKAANDRAMASIGPPPIMEMGFDMPYQDVSPTGLATGLKIASSTMPYVEKGWQMTAPGGSFFGIQKPNMPQKSTG
jgi:hypothetical protein